MILALIMASMTSDPSFFHELMMLTPPDELAKMVLLDAKIIYGIIKWMVPK